MREETLKYYSYNGMIGNLTFHKFILDDFCWIETQNTAFKGKYLVVFSPNEVTF